MANNTSEIAYWLDGEHLSSGEATLPVLSHGLHYAASVFEGIRSYNGQIFKLKEHIDRIFRSAEILGMEIPFSHKDVCAACEEVNAKFEGRDTYFRPVVWRGGERMGISPEGNSVHIAIAAWEWPSYYNEKDVMNGISMDIAEWRRPDPRTAPFSSKAAGLYMICSLSKSAAATKGFDDALMLDYRGLVAEATGANIFFVTSSGNLVTPTPDCFLNGITRQTVIEIASQKAIDVDVRAVRLEEIADFSECFLAGTAVEIAPVRGIGTYEFKPASITKTIHSAYASRVRGE